ncbi:MAG TPA: hypothetical protein ENN34_12100 [Deltaproteobacteria bacterium]|nr:hypothetical protein [Deltaproteobacteria bacterium]
MITEKHALRKQRELFSLLVECAASMGIEIIEDTINRRGGICRLDGRLLVVYDANSSYQERNRLIVKALSLINPDSVYLPPKIRQIIEDQRGLSLIKSG